MPPPRDLRGLWLLPLPWFLLLGGGGEEAGAGRPAVSCPAACLCASNILSCSKQQLPHVPHALPSYTAQLDLSHNNLSRLRAEWTPTRLPHLHSLLLSHNHLHFISSEAFSPVPNLRYLDLSSNQLRTLEEALFSELQALEVLLLYNNRIVAVDRAAFEDVAQLQKLYLSQNQIARFPLELVRLPKLALLDLSGNRLKSLPVAELQKLPAWVKNGLYLHNNPLHCSCELYQLFAHWQRRRLSPAVDFQEDLRCLSAKKPYSVFGLNCSEYKERAWEAHLGDSLTLHCDTKQQGMTKTWVTPGLERVPDAAAAPANGTARVLGNGSLHLQRLQPEDGGVYTCFAVGEAFNETLSVELRVHNFTLHGHHDTLNTAYTTLVGCILSVVLVLIYLYLTPCRCWCRGVDKPASPQGDSLSSSMLSTTPNHDPVAGGGGDKQEEEEEEEEDFDRRVAFLEPAGPGQDQNGKLKPGNTLPVPEAAGKGQRRMSDPESVSSVFSDTPIVV